MVPRTISVQSPGGQKVYVPVIQPKFADFIRRRARVFREIRNMRKISNHKNVIKLENVLELTQDSKTTIFLVMVSLIKQVYTFIFNVYVIFLCNSPGTCQRR